MPVDPTISLHVRGGDKGTMDPGYMPSANALNPMGQMSDVLGVVQKMNEVKQFNQVFSARQKAGEILASAPDLETAVKTLAQDPLTATFAPEAGANAMATNRALLDYSGERGKQGREAFDNMIHKLPAVLQDPGQWNGLEKSSLELASPAIRPQLMKSFQNLRDAITHGVETDPETGLPTEAGKKMMAQNLSGWITAAGAGDTIPKILEQPGQIDVGNKIQPVTVAPAQGGPAWLGGKAPGTVTPVTGNALTKGLAPQIAPQNGVRVGEGTGNAQPAQTPQPVATATPSTPSFFGSPLFDEKTEMKPPSALKYDVSGNPSGLEGNRAHELMDAHSKEDLARFRSAQDTEAQLADVGHDIESLAKGGGFLSPGAGGEVRTQVAKFGKMVEDLTGTKLGVDVDKIANAEDLMKATNRMTLDFLNSKLGNQREAAETIKNMTDKGMPGINNTLLGSRLMIGMIGALNQRTKDSYAWDDEWAGRNNGDLRGAAKSFDTKYNSKLYINKALSDLGMNEQGFTPDKSGRAALQRAVDDGLLTLKQAEVIRQNKGRIPDNLPKAEEQ